jgi:hypothetical protein
MLEDLARFHEEGSRAPGPIRDGGEGIGRAQPRVGLRASRARNDARGERGRRGGAEDSREDPSPQTLAQDDLAPAAPSRENGSV